MSDLFEVREKVEEGAQWRGEINVMVDGESKQLTVRQLRDPEFWEVMTLIDTDEIQELQDSLPEDQMEELRELRDSDDLTEEEEERLETLQQQIEEEEIDMFSIISLDTFNGVRRAGRYGVEPDKDDLREVIYEHGGEIEEQYGTANDENARKWVQQHKIDPMFERATDFVSFTIGIQALSETIGDTGNLSG